MSLLIESTSQETIQILGAYFAANKRVKRVSAADGALEAVTRSNILTSDPRATYGERILATVSAEASGWQRLDLVSRSYSLFDWGRNGRNLSGICQHLEAAGFAVVRGPMTTRHSLG